MMQLKLAFSLSLIMCFSNAQNKIDSHQSKTSSKDILLQYEEESNKDEVRRQQMNELEPNLYKTSKVTEEYPTGEIYLDGSESVNGNIDLIELNEQLKSDKQKDLVFKVITIFIALIILVIIGRITFKK